MSLPAFDRQFPTSADDLPARRVPTNLQLDLFGEVQGDAGGVPIPVLQDDSSGNAVQVEPPLMHLELLRAIQPLATVCGFSELMLDEGRLQDADTRRTRLIHEAARDSETRLRRVMSALRGARRSDPNAA